MGPTASGKSRLSMALAERLPVEIISVDSALIYRGMDIGTAKPSAEELAKVPHHLIDILDPSESYSAADFVEDVHRLVAEIFERGRLPMLVGGTMMYFNALQKGMAQLPSADEALRAEIHQAWLEDAQAVHDRLKAVDPEAAERIHPNDPQRLVRALEVYEMTGRPLTELQKEGQGAGLTAFKLVKVALLPEDRGQLHQQIEERFHAMLNDGFLKEAETVFSQPGYTVTCRRYAVSVIARLGCFSNKPTIMKPLWKRALSPLDSSPNGRLPGCAKRRIYTSSTLTTQILTKVWRRF